MIGIGLVCLEIFDVIIRFISVTDLFSHLVFDPQVVPLTAAVIVTTPQKLAFIDVAKGVRMFSKLKVAVFFISAFSESVRLNL